ncbi:MAG: 2-phospho-L-lactate transferase [Chloroflexi bacterium]|nr:2-phospho-L-lactate transferase [Chloroflexota bacterium]
MTDESSAGRVVILSGGVGGARFAAGMADWVPPEALTVVVNVGDDFEPFNLRVSPDIDTVCYTLAGLENPETGWGRRDETWHAMETIETLGGPTWFRLGDRDLGLHLERTRRLAQGMPLSQVTRAICQALGVRAQVLPATDDSLRTWVKVAEHGWLPFQEYFVRHQWRPRLMALAYRGATRARPAPGVMEALHEAEVILLAPSNPWLSLDPILAVPGIRSVLQQKRAVAVSPFIAGRAVKGPAAKIARELGYTATPLSLAEYYQDILSGLVIDQADAAQAPLITQRTGIPVYITDTWMQGPEGRRRVAYSAWTFARLLASSRGVEEPAA